MKKVLFSTDLRGDVAAATRVAVQQARNLGAMLYVVYVEQPSSAGFVPLLDEARTGGPRSERQAALAKAVPIPATVPHEHVLLQGYAAPTVIAFAKEHDIDLVVMPTWGRRGLRRLLRGSVAEEVVRFAPCPVYTFRLDERAAVPVVEPSSQPSLVASELNALAAPIAPSRSTDRARVHEHLTILLSGEVTGLELWFQQQLATATTIARDPLVVSTLLELLALPHDDRRSEALLARVRGYMDVVSRSCGFSDFLALDTTGRIVASRIDAVIGHRLYPERFDFVASALAGEATVSNPTSTGLPVPGPRDPSQKLRPSVFAVAPILSGDTVRGALGLRLRGEELHSIVATSSPYESLESYVFDRRGTMLSPSRFEADLSRLGLPLDRDEDGLLHLLDPGGNMLAGHRPMGPADLLPFTKMAASAVRGESKVDLDGYRDYRGVLVVGAWRWLAEHDMGVAVEVDRAEAFRA